MPMEFAEVASTSMEYIGALYLHQAGLCTESEENLIRIQHLEGTLTNYLHDPQTALQQYRHALSLGATRTLPELYQAVGATFNFNAEVLEDLTQLILRNLSELEAQ
jgi:oligoendopeptidase F